LVEAPPFRPRHPDVWAATTHLLGPRRRGMPPYLALPRTRYTGAAYLGSALEPLIVRGDPNRADFEPPQLALPAAEHSRLRQRLDLLEQFDHVRRDLDGAQQMQTLDRFQQEAVTILTSDAARQAFDLNREDI